MASVANHFGHRESDGIVVDLFWDRGELEHEFRVELHPRTGREAIQAFYHPFSAARVALNGTAP